MHAPLHLTAKQRYLSPVNQRRLRMRSSSRGDMVCERLARKLNTVRGIWGHPYRKTWGGYVIEPFSRQQQWKIFINAHEGSMERRRDKANSFRDWSRGVA